jgi:hypothetical protein
VAGIGKHAKLIGFTVSKAEFKVLLETANRQDSSVSRIVKVAYACGMETLFPDAAKRISAEREAYRQRKNETRVAAAKAQHAGVAAAQKANRVKEPEVRTDVVEPGAIAFANDAADKNAKGAPPPAAGPRQPVTYRLSPRPRKQSSKKSGSKSGGQ